MSANKLEGSAVENKFAFGVDIGGTTIEIGLFSQEGKILSKMVIPTNTTENGQWILGDISAQIQKMLQENGLSKSTVLGIGMGVPGPVTEDGLVKGCVNLGWDYFNVKEEMENLTGLTVVADNDANLAALGEAWQGAAQGCRNCVFVTLGTAVGGGVIVDGKLLHGAFASAGEIGHILVEPDEKEACTCGNYGCLEQYASTKGLLRMAQKMGITRFHEAKEIYDNAKQGYGPALEMTWKAADYLGRGLSAVACVVDPEIFILGGGISHAGTFLLEEVQDAYQRYAFHASRDAKFALAMLGNQAGMYGGVKKLLDELQK
jgi:glucokinase